MRRQIVGTSVSVAALALAIACQQTSVEPTPVSTSSPPPTSSGSSTPPAGVQPVAENPSWTVVCAAGGSMTTTYNGGADFARLLTYYTGFDSAKHLEEQWDTVAKGRSVPRVFPACSQGDSEPESGRPAGHCYFDKGGNPTSDRAATASCKPTPTPSPSPSPSPSPTPSPSPSPTPSPTPPPECECYYEVSCGQSTGWSSCPSSTKRSLCEAKGGSWLKWQNGQEHCKIECPGVKASNFQLTPGKSASQCLKKH